MYAGPADDTGEQNDGALALLGLLLTLAMLALV
jgi:hypothetical protein